MSTEPRDPGGGTPPSTDASPRREQWGTRLGFVLAAVGSAVGLGNMWRFPYLTAENGGAAFLVLYLFFVLLIGIPLMLAEFSVGRSAQKSPIDALTHLGGPRWAPLGLLFVTVGFLLLSYYSVIAGWVVRYTGAALFTGFAADTGAHFDRIATGGTAVGLHLAFMALTVVIVLGGIRQGIERAVMVLMPLLFLIVLGLAAYAASLEGGGEGYAFYLQTDFGEVFSLDVLNDAAGQAFFSLSLGMGAMLTYASYLSRDENMPRESVVIALSDFGVAFVAGLAIFPVIFALGLSEAVGESTIGALFISLPEAFNQLGGATGRVVGTLFFAALLVGALTSAISLLEVVASSAIDTLGWSRRRAVTVFGAAIAAIGVPAAIDLDWITVLDQLVGTILLVAGGLFTALFVGWVMARPEEEVRQGVAGKARWLPLWRGFLRWVAPAVLAWVLFFSVRDFVEILGDVFGG
ncbi:MAG: sodium-dependent transporter [Gemmatimonadota bacterium]